MSQKNSGVQIANGFSRPVYVKNDVSIIKYTSEKHVDNLSLQVQTDIFGKKIGPSSGKLEKSSTSEAKTEYNVLHTSGFSILPEGEVTSYYPPSEASNSSTVFVTIYYLEKDGTPVICHNCRPLKINTSWIITKKGGLVPSKHCISTSNGKNHGNEVCPFCTPTYFCRFCDIERMRADMQESIGIFQICHLSESLIDFRANLENVNGLSKNEDGRFILREISTLAEQYCQLETKTLLVIQSIQSYGENLKDAAEDFKNHGISSDFLEKTSDLKGIKASLNNINQQHNEIKHFVRNIQQRANNGAARYEDCSEKAKKKLATLNVDSDDFNYHSEALMLSIPIYGSIRTTATAAAATSSAIYKKVDGLVLKPVLSVPLKWGASLAGGVAAGLGGLLSSIISLPAAPFLWGHFAYHRMGMETNNFVNLTQRCTDIAIKMGLVEVLFVKIEDCLGSIENLLNEGIEAERHLLSAKNEERRCTMAERAVNNAQMLISECKNYYDQVKNQHLTMTSINSQNPNEISHDQGDNENIWIFLSQEQMDIKVPTNSQGVKVGIKSLIANAKNNDGDFNIKKQSVVIEFQKVSFLILALP